MTLTLAQTPAFPPMGRTGLRLAIAMANHWEMLSLQVYFLMGILQRVESFFVFWEIHAPNLEYGSRAEILKIHTAILAGCSVSDREEAHMHQQHLNFTYMGSSRKNTLSFYSNSVSAVRELIIFNFPFFK